jgi:hypothetical protein
MATMDEQRDHEGMASTIIIREGMTHDRQIPYQVLPGNHEAACAEFDGPGNILTAYLDDDKANSTANATDLTYYSCPPSQRNFTGIYFNFFGFTQS